MFLERYLFTPNVYNLLISLPLYPEANVAFPSSRLLLKTARIPNAMALILDVVAVDLLLHTLYHLKLPFPPARYTVLSS